MNVVSVETASHLSELYKIMAPLMYLVGLLISGLVAMIVWAWKKMEKSQDKIMTSLETHMANDESIHDALFDRVRAVENTVVRAAAFHEINHPGQKLGDNGK